MTIDELPAHAREPLDRVTVDDVGEAVRDGAAGLPVLREVTGPGRPHPLRSLQPVADGAAAV